MNEEILNKKVADLNLPDSIKRTLEERGIHECGDFYKAGVLSFVDLNLKKSSYIYRLFRVLEKEGLDIERLESGVDAYSPAVQVLLRTPIKRVAQFFGKNDFEQMDLTFYEFLIRYAEEKVKYGRYSYRHGQYATDAGKEILKDLGIEKYKINDESLPKELIQEQLDYEKKTEGQKKEMKLEDIPIEKLGLSIRAYNRLYRNGIHNLAQLLSKDEAYLLHIRDMGMVSVNEIKATLKEMGYTLGHLPKGEEEKANDDSELLEKLEKISIGELNLSVRAHNGLFRAGIKNLAQLLSNNYDDLLQIKDLGPSSVNEIKGILEEHGYKLGQIQKTEEEEKVKTEEKDELLEKLLTSEEGLGVLVEIPCQSFVKGSEEYEKISTAVEAYLNETLKNELKTANSVSDFERISVLLENMRNSFKETVNSKREELGLIEQTKARFSAIQQAKNGDVKKFHHKTQTDPEQRHSHNPFAEDLGREL